LKLYVKTSQNFEIRVPTVRESQGRSGNFEGVRESQGNLGKTERVREKSGNFKIPLTRPIIHALGYLCFAPDPHWGSAPVNTAG